MACVSLSTAKSCVTLFKSLFVSIHTIYICVPYAMDHIKHSFSAASWAFLWLHILRQFSVSKHWNMDNLWSGWLIAIKNICFSDVTQHFLHCIFMSLRARSEEHTIKKSLSFDQIIFYLPFIIKPKREEKNVSMISYLFTFRLFFVSILIEMGARKSVWNLKTLVHECISLYST